MSRMDVLTNNELKEVIKQSKLVEKYNDEIDRESAYEILNEKIEKAEKVAEKEKTGTRRTSSKRTSTKRKSTRMNPIIKVLTSATFIRGVLGVMKKVIR